MPEYRGEEPCFNWREQFYYHMIGAYAGANKGEALVKLYRQMIDQFSDASWSGRAYYGLALHLLEDKRYGEAATLLEKAVKLTQAGGDSDYYCSALHRLYNYYNFGGPIVIYRSREYRERRDDPDFKKSINQKKAEFARRAADIFDLAMKEAEGKRGSHWRWWSNAAFQRLDKLDTDEEREEFLIRILELFSWKEEVPQKAHYRLAHVRERLGKWEAAAEDYRYLLENEYKPYWIWLPFHCDREHLPSYSRLDERINAKFRIANIHHKHLDDIEEAHRRYRGLVEQHGVVHYLGVNVCQALHELGEDVVLPTKAALVWGGGGNAQKAWSEIVGPMGLAVHSLRQDWISGGHLAPYQLLILVRSGTIPFAPGDVLAMRNYVATGGSLLVIVSPGWEHAQPGIHNPLLSFFDVRADHRMVVRAHSTQVKEHPITVGIEKALCPTLIARLM